MSDPDIIAELRALAHEQDETVRTTFSLSRRTMRRLKKAHQDWGQPMSWFVERGLAPILDQLEKADPPGRSHDDDEVDHDD
ncbi:hypothetical protein QDT91_28525 (plasmid) [Mycolicibacterium aubagnense]|jgi:hypothetical protein|uniref:hypothetical protein n=1 Tax=Mycolicibacterium aubagnense TaxID=319707 RepID=UPI0013F61053|nr:hypothetical protein [Mycolicibacterium aubagnense]WGI35955.1 hypothetical protein QDT91_28525 [Mycolicibacterium aubagnense]